MAIRQHRFNAALITAAIVNCNRVSEDSPAMSPFDFLPGFERDPAEEERQKLRASVKRTIAFVFAQMFGKTREQVLEEKAKMIARLTENGIDDPVELIREVYPDL